MTTVVVGSRALQDALRALPEDIKRALRVKQHPHGKWWVIVSRSYPADRAALDLAERFGEARWLDGRWHVRRPQLRLPGL